MIKKPGRIMATAPGPVRTKIFDGRRDRVLWIEGDGDGEPSKHLIDRCLNTVNGHPTWRLYCGEPTEGIIRGKNEPPRYVYLDDRACSAVLSSQSYDKEELKSFWAFDFDNLGNIRTKRPNRGKPAYVDDSCQEYAKGPMRGSKKVYEFSGAPAEAHIPPCPVKVEAEKVYVKPSARISLSGALPPLTIPSLYSTPDHSTSSSPSTTGPVTPGRIPLGDTPSMYYSRPCWTDEDDPISNARIKYEHTTPNYYVSGPVDGTLKPLGMAQKAMQGSPYFDAPSAGFRKNPRFMPGDLSHLLRKETPRKRDFIAEAFDDEHKDNDHVTKRVKMDEEPAVE